MPENSSTATSAVYVPGRFSPRQLEWMRQTFAFLFRLVANVEIRGQAHLPPDGGFIVTPNHVSWFDTPLGFVSMAGYPVISFAADTYRNHWLFSPVLEATDVIWVNRGATGPSAIKAAVKALKHGRVLGLAPEGTRSRVTYALQPGKTGAAYIALLADAPIVPLALVNTEKLEAAMRRFKRISITATFGKPYRLPPSPTGRPNEAHLDHCTTEIMCQLAALLPVEYRGVYTEHPRVRELLKSGE
jgi:1-acyl-sn-glycerol-3-phosphate acyltransferase